MWSASYLLPPWRLILSVGLALLGFQAQEYDAVSRVEGQSLTVECHYSAQHYSETLKAWCKLRGKVCSPLVRTSGGRGQNKVTSGRFTIQDDTSDGIVTVTMKKLQVQDSGVYWCAYFESSNTVYRLQEVKLNVSKEVQEYNAMEGQNLSVQCPYNPQHYSDMKKAWCRTVQKECEVLVYTGGPITNQNTAQKGRTTIHDDTEAGIVTVTMEKLQADDAGVYWCAHFTPPTLYRIIEVKLTVTKAITTTSNIPVSSSTHDTSLIPSTAGTGITTTDSSLSSERTFIILGVTLGILFLLALIGVVILYARKSRHLKRRGDGRTEGMYEEPRNTTEPQDFSHSKDPKDEKQERPPDLKYATLTFKSRPSPKENIYANVKPSQELETPHTVFPPEPVEYTSISLKPLASGAKP